MANPGFKRLYEHGLKIMAALGKAPPAPATFNPLFVGFYEAVGYLPEAILNCLLLLGWALDDKTDFLTVPQMIEHFSLERVVRSPAHFDADKLWSLQTRHMALLTTEQKLERMLPFMTGAGLIAEPVAAADREKLSRAIAACGDRLKVSGDVLLYTDFFFRADDAFVYDEADFKKHVQAEGAVARLQKVRAKLADLATFDVAALEAAVHGFVEAEGLKMGDIVHTLRVAVTGRAVGPGLYDCLAILGKASVLARIDRAVKLATGK
jgi:glutamyl-tRNA synthetase